ncbi:MAG TPA: CHASE4 domain-containing protein [Woeseiaceae bacterium]|nr:CHASE4 domain-containing protein [Woeseiaceae bacterium]
MSNKSPTSQLQRKVSLTLLLLIAVFVLISYFILRVVIAPAFDDLEMAAAKSDMRRAEAALRADIKNLEAITADWAPWDDIYYYVSGQNPSFEKSNLDRPTLVNLDLDIMAIYATNQQFVWGQILVDGDEVAINTLEILNPRRPSSMKLTEHHSDTDQTLGFVRTGLGLMIISSRPILRSDDSGPVAGALVMGQLLDAPHLETIRERTEVDINWTAWDADRDSLTDAGFKRSDTSIVASQVLNDIYGQPALVLETRSPRRISQLGSRTINMATMLVIVAGALICTFMWIMLRNMVLRPIEQLENHINTLRKSGDLSRQIVMPRNDEIGSLARQFNSMTTEVNDARQSLLEQSFKAGKADTAAEIMHNIRNAMTPMINGLERIRKSFTVAENLRVDEAVRELGNPDCPQERKEKFLEYISASFEHLKSVGANAIKDLNVVSAQAKQIEGIISDQEKFANVAPLAEVLQIAEVLEEATHVIPKDKVGNVEVVVDNGIEKRRVRAYRIGLLQVMGNLVLNAYESIKRSGTPDGKITLAAVEEMVGDSRMIKVTVRDNGGGFDLATRDQIFRRGYTSKAAGEFAGLGLHWCANAVASMGGKLSAESEGHGRGAAFHVLLPAAGDH